MKLFCSRRGGAYRALTLLVLLAACPACFVFGSEQSRESAREKSAAAAHDATTGKGASGEANNAAGSAQAANGAAPGQPTAPKPSTAIHLELLPQPLPPSLTQGIDVNERSAQILQHLSEAIKFYRLITTPIQKTGEPSDMVYAEQAQNVALQITQLAFQAARDEAALLSRVQGAAGTQAQPPEGSAQRLRAAQAQVAQHIQDFAASSPIWRSRW